MSILFEPLTVGALRLPNRIVMAPLTRRRAGEYRAEDSLGPRLKQAFGGVYIVNENFTKEQAEAAITTGEADAVAFGKAYIANPDLVRRLRENAALNEWDTATFYSGGAKGYTDYPFLA